MAERLVDELHEVDFSSVVDWSRKPVGGPAPRVEHTPHIDLAVIGLDPRNRVVAAANVQQSRDFPEGRIVSLGDDLRTLDVDFRAWDLARWDDAQDVSAVPYPEGSAIVPGVRGVPFMSPYPASTFKLLVAVQVLRMVDVGRLDLTHRTVNLTPGAEAIEGSTLPVAGAEPTVAEALETMITYSDNVATCLLLQQLHVLGQLEPGSNALNATFASRGMPTLQVNDTDARTGTRWGVGRIHMGAMDTARLLLLLHSGRDVVRRSEEAGPTDLLSEPSRRLLLSLLGEQGLHEVLSTTNWCGRSYPGRGIPAQVPTRWIDEHGFVRVDGISYASDVRPCNATAEVTFAHKTGLTENYGSDAGIVIALPGGDDRRYVVAVFTNLGYRFTDASRAEGEVAPCSDGVGVCYSQKFGQLGRRIDDLMRRR